MNFQIIIPAHNEEDAIGLTLQSLVAQTLQPTRLIVVNDNSTDGTQQIIDDFSSKYPWIQSVSIISSDEHLPGTKIVNAFYAGFELLKDDYDAICKFDADLIFPPDYLETLAKHFEENPKLGMVSGFCYIKKKDEWVLEGLTGKEHIRGALKCYRRACFLEIGKIKRSMGWDTIDELLAKFYGWEILTDDSLKVKHLKPTGKNYNKTAKHLQGEAMYKMRYGLLLTFLSGLKMSYKKQNLNVLLDYMGGYLNAIKSKPEPIVTEEQGKFMRNLRWKGVKKSLMRH